APVMIANATTLPPRLRLFFPPGNPFALWGTQGAATIRRLPREKYPNAPRQYRQFKPRDGVDSDGDRDRHRRHDRRWRFHQPRVPGERHHVGFFSIAALGRGGNRRAVRGALLWRAWSYVSALERRVQFSRALLSSSVWISRGLGLRHGRVRRTNCTRRHGVWRIFQSHRPGNSTACTGSRGLLACRARTLARHSRGQRIPEHLDGAQVGADHW